MSGPLQGLRVLELASGIAGPYAGRLFAMLGADVVKVEPDGGDPSRRLRIDDGDDSAGALFVHLNAGKRFATDVDLDGVHVVLDDRVRHQRRGTDLDPERIAATTGAVVVSVTAWGFGAEHAGEPADELLVQAVSGMLPATVDDGRPHRFPGWQSQYLAGGFAVTGALTALSRPGGHHVDVSWVGSVLTGVEGGTCAYLHAADRPKRRDEDGRDRQAGFQVGAFPAGAFRCKDGHVIPGTVRPVDWDLQVGVYGMPELLEDERFHARHRFVNRDELRSLLQPWYDARTKTDIFGAALDAGWACGMVMTAADALADPHLAERGFLAEAEVDGARATVPARPWRVVPPIDDHDAQRPSPPPLERLKVIELTWAWAGPFVGRYLGAYGADVVRVEAGRYPDGWRTRLKWKEAGVPIPEGADPEDSTFDAAALHNSLNRNKRSLSLDLTHDDGKRLFLELLPHADLLVLNMSYRMLADRGIEDEVHAAIADHGLIVLNMPALGATGPYRDMPGYGILMEGMGGFAARYGTRDEGARATATYYPDLVAGLHGTVAALSALAHRSLTGEGRLVDLSQQEVTWLQLAEAIALRSSVGREVERLGDAEPGCVPSGYYPTEDGRWLALVVRDDAERAVLESVLGAPVDGNDRGRADAAVTAWTSRRTLIEALTLLQTAGVRAVVGRTYDDVYRGGDLEARGMVERLVHPLTGDRAYVCLPVRIDGDRWASRRPAARFAEHTDAVLRDWLAIDDERLADLRAREVVGTVPRRRNRR